MGITTIHKIYVLYHPKTKEIRYVGRTCRSLMRRLGGHIYHATIGRKSDNSDWIRHLLRWNLKPIIVEIDRIEGTLEDGYTLEKYWINFLRSKDCRLTNISGCKSVKVQYDSIN